MNLTYHSYDQRTLNKAGGLFLQKLQGQQESERNISLLSRTAHILVCIELTESAILTCTGAGRPAYLCHIQGKLGAAWNSMRQQHIRTLTRGGGYASCLNGLLGSVSAIWQAQIRASRTVWIRAARPGNRSLGAAGQGSRRRSFSTMVRGGGRRKDGRKGCERQLPLFPWVSWVGGLSEKFSHASKAFPGDLLCSLALVNLFL